MDRPRLDLAAISTLSFENADEVRFPCLALARAALRAGGAMPTVLNAANEIAVAAFMAAQVGFYGVSEIVERVCTAFSARSVSPPASVEEALAVDEEARRSARAVVGGRGDVAPDGAGDVRWTL
jgi:1-deoxy-D-xylulose-5-phosphate reductoisomerase